MWVIVILALVSSVFGETPPYPASGWRPQGQPFNLPSRQQQPQPQYGAPPLNEQQQYNTIQFSAPQQLNQQYSAPQINNQYNSPQINNQYGAPQISNQYGAPQVSNQYGVPSVDPLRSQNVPREEPARNFAGNNFNFNQVRPTVPGRTYLSQTPINNNQNPNFDSSSSPNLNNGQRQTAKLISPNSQFEFASNQNFQNVEPFNQRQNFNQNRGNEEVSDSDELNQDQLENLNGEELTPEREYGTPTTTKRPIKAPRKPERTTARPRTTTEQPDNEGDFDQPNVAVSTAVAGSSTTGQYYILQPDGMLQRVVYMTSPDPKDDKSAAVIANLMYETVEPLKGPIYQYVGSELVRIN